MSSEHRSLRKKIQIGNREFLPRIPNTFSLVNPHLFLWLHWLERVFILFIFFIKWARNRQLILNHLRYKAYIRHWRKQKSFAWSWKYWNIFQWNISNFFTVESKTIFCLYWNLHQKILKIRAQFFLESIIHIWLAFQKQQ